ncbi:SIMPL domain-containing protein [Serinibacter arcticus]|uniref:SIMPL domain-containing protein n=1 Tax=Serinibacter arcticus TaxID=1655435 RepID=UPI001304AAEF|nr:SIMPL domain-containing protein [Serinibacter arcticus]
MVSIAVTGEAGTRIAAERGTVTIRIEASGDDRTVVVDRAVRQHAALVAEAKAFVEAGDATAWEAADVSTGVFEEWIGAGETQERVRRFRAQARVSVRFADFGALGAWSLDVAGREDVAVENVAWALSSGTRASAVDTLRAEAARDATARAAAYAAALGLPTPRLTALWEDGLRPGTGGSSPGFPEPARAMRAMAFDAGGGPTLELQPQDIELAVVLSADLEA